MFKLPVIAALAPVGVGFWIAHPNTATTMIAAGTVGAAVVESKLRSMAEDHRERKAAKAVAQAAEAVAQAAERQALPVSQPVEYQGYRDWSVPKQVIDLGRAQ